ncbi:MAG: hypothetical protein LH654_13730, partial [Thermoleophilia bacterium]|nr:hypothetical protein [Thermoleophilia bacterium]
MSYTRVPRIEAVRADGRRSIFYPMTLMPGTRLILALLAAVVIGLVGVPSALPGEPKNPNQNETCAAETCWAARCFVLGRPDMSHICGSLRPRS